MSRYWCCLRLLTLPLAVLALTSIAGCAGETEIDRPATYPVHGKVLKAGEPITAGTIEFTAADGGPGRASGEIQPDGTFSLNSIEGVDVVPGALPGKYSVTVIPPMPADQQVQMFHSKQTYQIEDKENELTVQVN